VRSVPQSHDILRRKGKSDDADVVVSATPIDLNHLLAVNKPIVRAQYEFAETGEPKLSAIVDAFVAKHATAGELSLADRS
jgi:predicted GTPase